MPSFFPRDVLDGIRDLIWSVSEGFPTYFFRCGVPLFIVILVLYKYNKSIACGCQRSAVAAFRKSFVIKRGITLSKNGELSPLLVWVTLLIINNCSEFQVNIFSNNRDIGKCQSFRTTPPTTAPHQGYDNQKRPS